MTACVFAWEERAVESSTYMLKQIQERTRDWPAAITSEAVTSEAVR
jgi:hypothetical protein